jgi:uncharacterized protein YndB with AHSA1/START domain
MGASTAARTTPEILALEAQRAWPAWPPGCEPARCPVFVRNQLVIPAPPERVFAWLERADLWPTWFARVTKLHFDHGGPALAVNDVVDWHMLGAKIRVTVRRVERGRLLEWEGGASGVHAYHTWLLEPVAGGTLVLTNETEHGSVPSLLSAYLRHALKDAHQSWLESLARVVATGDPPRR